MELTHDQLGEIAARYLRSKGWHLALSNLWAGAINEKPDCLAIDIYGKSFVVEAKMSRADFFADQKKRWRKGKDAGTGDYRAYITPPGLLKLEEIPYGWQLWEVTPGKRPAVKVIKGQKYYKAQCPWSQSKQMVTLKRLVNCTEEEFHHFHGGKLFHAFQWTILLLRRIEASGVDLQKFAASDELWKK